MRPHLHKQFLTDVGVLAFTAFGGPAAHIAHFLKLFVEQRKIISKEELLELNALCQMLPGPTSTQTLVAIGYKLGGAPLAYWALFIWVMPATLLLTLLAWFFSFAQLKGVNLAVFKFLPPMIVGLVFYAGMRLVLPLFKQKILLFVSLGSFALTLAWRSPFVFPVALLFGGFFAYKFQPSALQYVPEKKPIRWANFWLFASFLLVSAVVGAITKSLPVLLFENTYRFGSMVYGGGYSLVPIMYDQYVVEKAYLSSQEFLTGFSIAQALPGPVFGFASYANAMALSNFGTLGIVLGAIIGVFGIFMPGTFLIFFVYPAWNQIKKIPTVFKSIKGVDAASSGFVLSASVILFEPIHLSLLNVVFAALTALIMWKTKLPFYLLVVFALVCGLIF